MAATVTRKSIADFKELLQNEDFCIIPNELIKRILDGNNDRQDLLVESHQGMVQALERIAVAMETTAQSTQVLTQSLLAKVDVLISKVGTINTITSRDSQETSDNKLQKTVIKIVEKEAKVVRATELSQYYNELLSRDVPYAPHKFRTLVNRSTPEYEKNIYNDDTIHKVSREVKLMEERIKNWTEELQVLQLEMDNTIDTLDPSRREKFTKTMQEKTEKAKNEWIDSFAAMKKTYADDMASGATQFLLKYSEEEESDSENRSNKKKQKNWRSRGKNPGRGRGRGNSN